MRRSKQTAAEPETIAVQPSNVSASAAPRPVAPAAAEPAPAGLSAELTGDDLDRGRTTALIATLGRVQLTLDLIERRMGRLEDSVAEIRDALTEEREAGLVPAELAYLDAPIGEADEDEEPEFEAGVGQTVEEAETEEPTGEPDIDASGTDSTA